MNLYTVSEPTSGTSMSIYSLLMTVLPEKAWSRLQVIKSTPKQTSTGLPTCRVSLDFTKWNRHFVQLQKEMLRCLYFIENIVEDRDGTKEINNNHIKSSESMDSCEIRNMWTVTRHNRQCQRKNLLVVRTDMYLLWRGSKKIFFWDISDLHSSLSSLSSPRHYVYFHQKHRNS